MKLTKNSKKCELVLLMDEWKDYEVINNMGGDFKAITV